MSGFDGEDENMPIKQADRLIVRDYITAQDHLQYTQLPADVVAILLTHSNLPAKHVDIRLKKHMTVCVKVFSLIPPPICPVSHSHKKRHHYNL